MFLDRGTEVAHGTLDGPPATRTQIVRSSTFFYVVGGGVRVRWVSRRLEVDRDDMRRKFEKHVNILLATAAFDETVHIHHPGCTLPTWCALTTRFVFVEL